MSMAKKARIGIVGMGTIGTVHAEALKKVPTAELVAVAEVIPDRLAQRAAEYKAHPYADYRKMLHEAQVDGVYVCVPNFAHCDITIAALKAGKHVFCEKPMALNAEQALRMVEAAKAARKQIQMGMAWRQRTESQVLRDYIAKGKLGHIYHMRTVLRRQRGVPGLGGWFTTKAMSGGGALIDTGVHFFDLVMWLSDRWDPERVSASAYNEFGKRMKDYLYVSMWAGPPKYDGVCDVDDYAAGHVRFPGGATLSFEISWAGNNEEDTFIEILGDKGGARACDGKPLRIITEDQGRVVEVQPKYEDRNIFEMEGIKFADVVLGKAAPPATGEQGLAVMRLLDAIYKSARLNKEVSVA
jgi:predicted dehydrogenase